VKKLVVEQVLVLAGVRAGGILVRTAVHIGGFRTTICESTWDRFIIVVTASCASWAAQ
jgi:hypothetical protein